MAGRWVGGRRWPAPRTGDVVWYFFWGASWVSSSLLPCLGLQLRPLVTVNRIIHPAGSLLLRAWIAFRVSLGIFRVLAVPTPPLTPLSLIPLKRSRFLRLHCSKC